MSQRSCLIQFPLRLRHCALAEAVSKRLPWSAFHGITWDHRAGLWQVREFDAQFQTLDAAVAWMEQHKQKRRPEPKEKPWNENAFQVLQDDG